MLVSWTWNVCTDGRVGAADAISAPVGKGVEGPAVVVVVVVVVVVGVVVSCPVPVVAT